MKTSYFKQRESAHYFLTLLTVLMLLMVGLFAGTGTNLFADHDSQPYCTAGTPDDFSDRRCVWNSGVAEWECRTTYEGCVVEKHGCGTNSCSVSVNYYCLVQNNGQECYNESEIRTTSCTNDCDGTEPGPDPDPTPPPPDEEDEEQTLQVFKDGTGTGTVTSTPSGINCGSTCSVTSENTRDWFLSASPASGSTFTRWSHEEYSYNSHCLRYGGKNNSCTEWEQAQTCGTLSQCKVTVSPGSTRSVTATFTAAPASTITGTLTANPTSGQVGHTFTFTAALTSRPSAVNPTTFTNPRCTRGFLGLTTYAPVSGSYTGSSDSNFTCVYAAPSVGFPTLSNVQGARMTINQGTASTVVAATVNVLGATVPPPTDPDPDPTPTLSVQLTGATGGIINQVLDYTANVTSTATGTIAYAPSCGTGGVRSNWDNSGDNTFSCVYASAGSRNVRVDVTQGELAAFATRTVVISEPTINGVDVEVNPRWIRQGGSTTVSWTTDPQNPGESTECRVDGGEFIPYDPDGDNEVEREGIEEVTEFTVFCENETSSRSGSAIVYILPTYSEF